MKRKGLIFVLLAIFSLFLVGNFTKVDAAATTVTKTSFSATSADLDNVVSYTTAKGGGTTNPAVNSNQIRLYQNSNGTGGGTITITIDSNYEFKSVTIGSSMKTSIAYTIDSSTTKSTTASLAANGKYTVDNIDGTSITFHCMGTSSSTRLYVNYLSVTYDMKNTGATTVVINEPATTKIDLNGTLEFSATTQNFEGTVAWSTNDSSIASFDGNVLTGHKEGEVEVTATAGEVSTTYETKIQVVDSTAKVKGLFTTYYGEGTYTKDTTINLTSKAQTELITHFHANANALVRSTYYTKDALWMSQDAEGKDVKYSYYGTAANNGGVTYGVADSPKAAPEKVSTVLSGVGKESMEAYYTTLFDLKENTTATWKLDGNGYATSDATMLQFFLDFTAPCLYNTVATSNYFVFDKATVEEVNGTLVLKLWVSGSNYGAINGGKQGVANVLSSAVISDREYDDNVAKIEYSYTFANNDVTGLGTKKLNNLSWTFAGEGSDYFGWDSNGKGLQFGKGAAPFTSFTVTSESLTNVSEITINTSGASSVVATLIITVGGEQVGSISLTSIATSYTFEVNNLTGPVEFTYTQTSSKAIYIKSITIFHE